MKKNIYKAFTLVELIVVITILAVLATVAFISLQWYSTESRDTKRITDVATLSKWLQVYLAAKSQVPEPSETKTTITFSGSELLTQWYAGNSVLDTLRVKEAKDPVDNNFYTYSTNRNNTKFQILALLEKNQTANNLINNNLFADYSDRNIFTLGDSVGVILNDVNQPVQDLLNTNIELQNNATIYKGVLNKNNTVTESGSILKIKILWAQRNLFWWRAFDFDCPIDDIVIWDQVWAGCNSTLGNWVHRWENNGGTTWIIGSCFNYGSIDQPSSCSVDNDLMLSSSNPNDYFKTKHPSWKNQNLDTEFNTIWWKLYTWQNAVDTACPKWWTLPSDQQWEELETYLNWWINCRNQEDGWRCSDLWWRWHDTDNNLTRLLYTPLSWDRNQDWFTYYGRGNNSTYWSATQADVSNAYRRWVRWDNDGIYRNAYWKNYSFSVRCIKK